MFSAKAKPECTRNTKYHNNVTSKVVSVKALKSSPICRSIGVYNGTLIALFLLTFQRAISEENSLLFRENDSMKWKFHLLCDNCVAFIHGVRLITSDCCALSLSPSRSKRVAGGR